MSTFARRALSRASARFSRKVIFATAIAAVSAVGAFAAFGPQALSLRTLLTPFVGAAAPVGNVAISHTAENEHFQPTAMLTTSGTLATARSGHTATLLADGRVLIVGGSGDTSAEIFDPATSLATATGNTNTERTGHTATRLADGRVLIAGGSSSEIYDPANGTFSPGPNMTSSRTGHTATNLAGGNVLIAGGGTDSSEVFDGTAFSAAGTLTASRTNHSAAVMNDGRVFIAGGTSSNTAEIYNPADGTFTAAGNAMTLERAKALLRVLPDGKVQIIGGNGDGSMEVYDPAIDTIGAYAHVVPASDPCANLINYVLRAETRAALIFSGASAPERDRSGHTVTELASGEALVIGGTASGGAALNSVTVFQSSNATVTTDKLDYAPGETVTLSGTGYAPGETVRVMIHEDPHTPQERGFDAVADASGNFTGTYVVQDYDLDMKFIVGARGLTSGNTAQTTFTDGAVNVRTDGTSGTSSSVSWERFSNTSCSGSPVASGSITSITTGNGTGIPSGTVSGQSLRLTSQLLTGFVFSNWSNDVPSSPNTSNPICVPHQNATRQIRVNFVADNTAPTVTINQAAGQADPTNVSPINFTVVFSESVGNFVTNDVTLSGTAGATTQVVTGSGTTYNVAVSGMTSNGTVIATIAANKATDAAGNQNTASTSTDNTVQFGPTKLAITSINAGVNPTYGDPFSVVVQSQSASNVATNVIANTNFTLSVATGTGTIGGTITGTINAGTNSATVTGVTYSKAENNVSLTATRTSGDTLTAGTSALFDVLKRAATWTTNPASKTYGDADPVPLTTGSGSNFVPADGVTATYGRVAGENASPPTYHITATLSATGDLNNYIITNAGAEFTINKRLATWTTNPASKTYGDADPIPLTTGSGSNFIAADNVTATYGRVAGENASPPTYHISATLSATPVTALDNYIITNTGAEFTINKRLATWTTNPASKTYGDPDPAPLTTGSGSNFVAGDNVTATYARVAGENASPPTYHITATLSATPLSALDNYIITNGGAEFTINKRLATWTTNAASKTYGDADPIPLTTGSGSNFVAADNVTATYARVGGENASPPAYHITATLSATPLSALDNYIITNDGAEFTINKRLATWTTNAASKTYGDPDPVPLTTGSGTNFVDTVTATYSRVAGENASPPTYLISASLSAAPGVLDNYIVTNAGAEFTINKRLATWTTNPNSKTYGALDPVPLTTGSGSNFVAADNVTAVYSRAGGEELAGNPYHITATLSATPLSALDNYVITNDGADFTIAAATLSIDAVANSKEYGEDDPEFDYTLTGFAFTDDESDVTGEAICTRTTGQAVAGSPYTITCVLGTLAADNYVFETGATAEFIITPAVLSVNAVANSKTYGDGDPAFGYTLSGFKFSENETTAGVTGAAECTRTAGETVAGSPYTISCAPGDLSAANYLFLDGSGAQFIINKRLATWNTNPASKTYGDADPVPLTTGSGSNFIAADGVTATYTRVAGENATLSTYHITATLSATPLAALDNYIITNAGAEFTINKRLATWTTNPNSKTYGDVDPVPLTTGSGSNFVAADNVTATYARVAGENASPPTYHITATLSATPLAALDNYIITNAGAEFTINKRLATWTTNPNSKTYGDPDPVPLTTGSGTNFVAADNVTATYARVAGENASPPTYHITATLSATPLSALDNYVITNDGAEFTINKRLATWTTNAASKTYGDADPVPLTTGSGSNFVAADNVTATYDRVAGENASPPTYHITATLSATGDLNNYIITNDGAEFTINKRLATWTTNAASKTYGDADPVPLTTGSGSNFVAADNVTATYDRVAGENASPPTYHITATLSATGDLNNYIITNDGAEFTINKRLATWTTDPASKTYGDADPVPLTTGSGSNFVAADGVTATYSRVAGEQASPPTYHITATLSATGDLNNYIITNDGAEFTIDKLDATWTTNPNSKTYGEADPVPLTTGSGDFLAADNISATYSRALGEDASPPTYHITATLVDPDGKLGNYNVTNAGAEFTIDQLTVTVTPDSNQFKIYGDADPVLTYQFIPTPLPFGDTFSGALSRNPGENAGMYEITKGSLDLDSNYILVFVGGPNFEIKKATLNINADDASKVFGESDPAFTYQLSGFKFSENATTGGVTGSPVCTRSNAGVESAAVYANVISCTPGTLSAANYNFATGTSGDFTINKRNTLTTVSSSLNPSIFGQNVTFTATVVGTGPGAGNPTSGSVQFKIDSVNFGAPVPLAGGSATSGTTNTLTTGNHTVEAVFTSADTNFNNSSDLLNGGQNVSTWTLTGFYQPVGVQNTYGILVPPMAGIVWNSIKGGQTVPLKFNVFAGSVEQTNTSAVAGFSVGEVSCTAVGTTDDPVDFVTTGATELRYSGGQFIQNWQTPKTANKCYRTVMTTLDGSVLVSFFKTKK